MHIKMANRITESVPTNYTMDQYLTCRSTLNSIYTTFTNLRSLFVEMSFNLSFIREIGIMV